MILLLSIFSSQCMEDSIDIWTKCINTGPLLKLKFDETEPIDNKGRHFGWLYATEFNDYVFVAITAHDTGYYVDYIDPVFKVSLPCEFYYWKSLDHIKKSPLTWSNYVVKEVSWSTKPMMIPSVEYNEELAHDSIENKAYLEAFEAINAGKRADRYSKLPSFEKAFDNCCSNVYLFQKIKPVKLVEQDKLLINDGYEYRGFSEEKKKQLLGLLPDHAYQLLRSWLENKLKHTGLSAGFYTTKESKEYVMNKDRVIDQFIIESLVWYIKKFADLNFQKNYPNAVVNIIDVYQILEEIEALKPCSSEDREEFEQELINRFWTWGDSRIQGLTALGIINCNNGLLQWD